MKELSIVVICIDPERPILERFLSSVRQYTHCDYELIFVDNAGADAATSAFIQAQADRYIRLEHRAAVGVAWNVGIAASTGRFVLVSNDDVVVPRQWFEEMRDVFLTEPTVGLVGPVMNYAGAEQAAQGKSSHLHLLRPVKLPRFRKFIVGAFMLFTRESLAKVGNFSEEFEIAGGEDLDMCFKLFAADLDIYVHHRVFVYHEWGSTGNRILGSQARLDLYEANYAKFKRKWSAYTQDMDRKSRFPKLQKWLADRIAPYEP